MPDLTTGPNSYVADNYRRALASFSRFNTRKLAYYRIIVYGLNSSDIDTLMFGETVYQSDEFPSEYIEQPKSIIEAVQRGVQLVAEPYAYGDWDFDQYGPDYYALYLTAVVAADTFDDRYEQNNGPVPQNQNSYYLRDAIEDAIGNEFVFDYVDAERMILRGDYLDTIGTNALNRGAETNKVRREADMNAKVAAGKISLPRKP